MKKIIRKSDDGSKIYIPKTVGFIFLLLIPVVIVTVGLYLFFLYGRNRVVSVDNQYQSLGSLGTDIKVTPGDSNSAAQVMSQRIQKEVAGKLTLIFFYDGYDNQKDAILYVNVMKEALKLVEPYKSLSDFFAYKIFTTEGKKCHVENHLLVCDKELINSFRKLGIDHFKVILMSPEEFTSSAPISRGANSWLSISTFSGNLTVDQEKRWIGVIFTHLLGHSLGLSYESADPSKIINFPPPDDTKNPLNVTTGYGRPNCAPNLNMAQKWWGAYTKVFSDVGFFQGCEGQKDYYYPVKNTLMSEAPTAQGYGIVSEDYLRGVLSCFYGNKESLIFPAGFTATYSASLNSCDVFKKDYPNFWSE